MSKQANTVFDETAVVAELAEKSLVEAEALASYGYLTSRSKRVVFEEPNGRNFARKNDEITVPSGTRRVRVVVRAADIGFGNLSTLSERPLGKLYYNVSINSFSGNLVTYTVTALCRDSNGDDPWWGRLTVEVMCFGP